MEIQYRRDMNRNYLVAEEEGITGKEYALHMLERNEIEGFLRLQIRQMNGKTALYFDITSLQPMSRLYENSPMSEEDIRLVLEGIRTAFRESHRYLLDVGDLLLDPEYIYLDQDQRKVGLMYVPGGTAAGTVPLQLIADYTLRNLNHADQGAVDLGYAFYAKVSRENFSPAQVLEELLENGGGRRKPAENVVGQAAGGRGYEEQALPSYPDSTADSGKYGKRRIVTDRAQPLPDRVPAEDYNRKKGKMRRKERADGRADGVRKKRKIPWKEIGIYASLALLLLLVYGGVVWKLRFDLTQAGGLAALMIALYYLAYRLIAAKEHPVRHNRWITDEDADEAEAAFMKALVEEVYDTSVKSGLDPEEPRQPIQARQQDMTQQLRQERGIQLPPKPAPAMESSSGQTRCLAADDLKAVACLVSLDPRRCPDLVINGAKMLIGKKSGQVDLVIPADVVSRIHASIERQEEGCYLTDLGSTNGTFVNNKRLEPHERRLLRDGDRVSFAAIAYRFRIREL